MHRIDSDGHQNNLFVDEDANQAIAGTKMAADWLNAIQEELINILVAAEIDPNKASNNQLALAFQLLGGSKDWADILNKPATFPPSAHTHSYLPVGSIITRAGSTVPTGYLECDGAAISRTTFVGLFAVCDDTFGAGNGSTTFNIPDLRGEFIRGWDNSRGVDSGRTFGSAQVDQFKAHAHVSGYKGNGAGSVSTYLHWTPSTLPNVNSGITGGDETRPRNIALMYCIKY